MDKFINSCIKNSRLLSIILLLTAGVIAFILDVKGYPDYFFPAMGHTFLILIDVGILISGPILLLCGKERAGKILVSIFVITRVYIEVQRGLSGSYALINGVGGLTIFYDLSLFIMGLLMISAVAFHIVFRVNGKNDFLKVSNCLAIITVCAYIVVFVARIIINIQYKAEFQTWVDNLNLYIIVPLALLFSYLFLTNRTDVIE